jgi:superfamily II DNA or RNA helicase
MYLVPREDSNLNNMKKELNLKQVSFKPSYDSFEDLPVENFFIPALNTSLVYRRAVGYFSSALITVLAEAFTNFAERGGKIELICSPILSVSDADTFEYLSRTSMVDALNRSLNNMDNDGLIQPPLNLMAALIKSGCLKIKFAVPYDSTAGIFHQKIGVFEDGFGNSVAFSGSNNESLSGWMEMKNSESFAVYTSWRDSNDSERTLDIKQKINRMWANSYRGFDISDFETKLDFIERRSTEDRDLGELKEDVKQWYEAKVRQHRGLEDGFLRDYQSEALINWEKNDLRGIICFATGAGKTITALAAVNKWREKLDKRVVIILVPTVRLQKQWLKEIRKFKGLENINVMLVGGEGKSQNWMMGLKEFTSFKRHIEDGIVIAVNRSASEESFYGRVSWGNHVLLIADEVHNLGAEGISEFLNTAECGAVLGLSATPNRYNDDENERVRELFGDDLKPVVDIPYAQELGVLVPYRYRFETLTLNDDEQEKYKEFTKRIGMSLGQSDSSNISKDSNLQLLYAQRANILKNAVFKSKVSSNLIRREYRKGSSWLVFCNDQNQLNDLKSDLRDLNPLDYHGGSDGDMNETIELFEREGGILLSINMLNEGIDIPSIDHCLIIASSQNQRQFIQRRGRVLRANKDHAKGVAEIWDLIIVNEDEKAFVDSELSRAIEFGRMAINHSIVDDLSKLAD